MGELNELKNRYLLINAPEHWEKNHTETEDTPNKYRTSTEQAPNKLKTSSPNIQKLIRMMGKRQLSMKEMLEQIGMKHRPTFLDNYLSPAIKEGYISLLYPDSPRHPRQRYLLSVKGLALFNGLVENESNHDDGYFTNKRR